MTLQAQSCTMGGRVFLESVFYVRQLRPGLCWVVMTMLHTSQYFSPDPKGILAKTSTRWAVLLLHGFTAGPQSVLPWAQALAHAGATVHVPLLSGHGTSVADLARTTAGQWRRDVQQALDELLSQGYDRVAVAGLSMGGTLALDAASNRPVDAVFVVNPGLSFRPLDQLGVYLSPLMQWVIPTVGPLAGDVRKPGVTEGAYDRTPLAAVEQLAKLFSVTRRHLADITAPVTLYWSPEDHILPRSSAQILRRGLEPHLLTTVILEQSFHAATLDYDAPLIDQDSITTLQKLSGDQHATA